MNNRYIQSCYVAIEYISLRTGPYLTQPNLTNQKVARVDTRPHLVCRDGSVAVQGRRRRPEDRGCGDVSELNTDALWGPRGGCGGKRGEY
ncbi:hypothetical protein E2C01_085264 [Portunus trituberculatus]|uniref:Uncharacterized protein n=1 Tax=Portunus trituberculatus TaxID=210409 RepID=A0A5B7JA03_PORTR|nr:hypothetical protein [Portunus trituberculatus]